MLTHVMLEHVHLLRREAKHYTLLDGLKSLKQGVSFDRRWRSIFGKNGPPDLAAKADGFPERLVRSGKPHPKALSSSLEKAGGPKL
jgi:hypothetical protein